MQISCTIIRETLQDDHTFAGNFLIPQKNGSPLYNDPCHLKNSTSLTSVHQFIAYCQCLALEDSWAVGIWQIWVWGGWLHICFHTVDGSEIPWTNSWGKVVYPIIWRVFKNPGGCLGFLPLIVCTFWGTKRASGDILVQGLSHLSCSFSLVLPYVHSWVRAWYSYQYQMPFKLKAGMT